MGNDAGLVDVMEKDNKITFIQVSLGGFWDIQGEMGRGGLEQRTHIWLCPSIKALAMRRAESAEDRDSFKELMKKEHAAKLRVEEKEEQSGVIEINICCVSQFHTIFT